MDATHQVPRRSTRLSHHSKRHGDLEEEDGPCVKRPCKALPSAMLPAGSPESASTLVRGTLPAASPFAPPSAAPAGSRADGARTCFELPSPSSYGSDVSEQTDAVLLRAASCSPVDGPAVLTAPAAPAGSAPASVQQAEQTPAQEPFTHPALSSAYLAELAVANAWVQRLPLPGGLPFYPVHTSCQLLPFFSMYGVSPAAVVLGASYLQRLLLKRVALRQAADQAGFFSLVQHTQGGQAELVMHARPAHEILLATYCACVYLGIKVTDGVKFSNQLSHMLTHVLGGRVESKDAVRLEMQVLQLLDWRLGPYCCKPHHLGPW